jgi:hypothetical protein
MSAMLHGRQTMARGESGRIVIEIEPEIKRRLYSALALSGSTLKDWFVSQAEHYWEESTQPSLLNVPRQPNVNDTALKSRNRRRASRIEPKPQNGKPN